MIREPGAGWPAPAAGIFAAVAANVLTSAASRKPSLFGVDPLEHRRTARELGAADLAVAVLVHRLEPRHRVAREDAQVGRPGAAPPRPAPARIAWTRSRNSVGLELAVLVRVAQLQEPLEGRPGLLGDLARLDDLVAVGVELLERLARRGLERLGLRLAGDDGEDRQGEPDRRQRWHGRRPRARFLPGR